MSMIFSMSNVFPSMPKGNIVGHLVFIDVNPWRVILDIDFNP
jgi:hypothetical protein